MSQLGSRDTAPELSLRSELHRRGLRFRVDRTVVPAVRTRPDLAFVSAKIAVFVDGCFWHVCPEHQTWPEANGGWWRRKLEANVERDRRTDEALGAAGWLVIRIWEHEDLDEAAGRVERAVSSRRR